MTTNDLKQIGDLIDKKLDQRFKAEREVTRNMIQHEIQASEKRSLQKIDDTQKEIQSTEKRLLQKIDDTQKETFNTMSELLADTYDLQNERIKIIEDHLGMHHNN